VAFYQSEADKACNFFEKVLKHTADDWYGKPFLLAPWEEEALVEVFGNLDSNGNRIIGEVYLEVPKKAGKTEFAAGINCLVLVTTKSPGCQCYGAAAATRQALNVYRAACKMVEQSPILSRQLRIMRGTNRIVKRSDPDSFYGAIAADGDFGDGVNPALTVADEVHRWKTRKHLENWDVLSNGGITRKQTLTIAITTAGVKDESPLAWKLHEKVRKIKDGIVKDPKFYGRIYAADDGDDPADPKTWIKANPSLKENGGFLDKEKIREKYEAHLAEGDLTSFKRYFLNIWDQKDDRAIDMVAWDKGSSEWQAEGLLERKPEDKVRSYSHEFLQRFFGRRCWAGVDLSMTTDMTSVVFLFKVEGKDEYEVLPFFWLPDANLRKMEVRLSVPLKQWAEQGFLELVPDSRVIDYRDVQDRLRWGAELFDLQGIYWDPWNSRQASVEMIEEGFNCVEVRQNYKELNEPTKKVLELVARGGIHHGNHPVLKWHASCCALLPDNRDNVMFAKPDRSKTTKRIDGIAAMTDALIGAIEGEGEKYTQPMYWSV
jgi:phage terminase large subunit-like protein